MIDESPLDPPNSKDYARRLAALEALSVNDIYGELMAYIKSQHDAIMKCVFVTPTTMEGVLARERTFGVAEEYEVLLSWLDNEKLDAKERFEQLKLEETQEKTQTKHED
jgi:hypothetical protein